ncbi:MAG: AI-2E family transporter [Candidatus Eisenbacteria bacterium]|nr:AI-2E family transporter [Candidatus Eisenbacteria bacterium]
MVTRSGWLTVLAGAFLFALALWSMHDLLGPIVATAALLFLLWPAREQLAVRRLMIVAGLLCTLWILAEARAIVYPALAALALAFLLDPAVDRLHDHKIPRGVAALAVMLPLLALWFFLVLVALPALADRARTLLEELPEAYRIVVGWIEPILADLTRRDGAAPLPEDLSSWLPAADQILRGVASGIVQVGRGVALAFEVGAFLLLTPILTYYILVDFDRLRASLRPYFPADYAENAARFGAIFQESVGAWFKGQLLVALIVAVLTTGGFLLIGFPYPFLIGVLAGMLNLVPILGFWITFVLALIVALFTPQPLATLLKTGGVLLAVQMLEQNLLGPRIVGRQLGVKPVVLLLTMLGLSVFLGVLGVFLAAPVIGIARAAWALWVPPPEPAAEEGAPR